MIGLDTNILLRYFVKDDLVQWEKATRFISTRCTPENPGFINRIALLRNGLGSHPRLRLRSHRLVRIVGQLLSSQELLLEDEELVRSAVQSYEGASIDFPDALMVKVNLARGCEATATFDRKAASWTAISASPDGAIAFLNGGANVVGVHLTKPRHP